MPPDRYPPDDPREWLVRARSNLALANVALPNVVLEDVCFEAQQAAKAIKAVLIARGIVFPYVHDLARLRTLLAQAGEAVPLSREDAVALTNSATFTRYPFDDDLVTEEEYRRAVAIAETVVAWAEERVVAHRAEPGR